MTVTSRPGRVAVPADARRLRPLRVAVVDDDALLGRLVADVIAAQHDMVVSQRVTGHREALDEIRPGAADVALVDIVLGDGNGVALAAALQRRDDALRIVLLSAHNLLGVLRGARSDAHQNPWSYLSKRSALDPLDLPRVIRSAAAGRMVIDPWLVRASRHREGSELDGLSRAQLDVLSLLVEGYSNDAIAHDLDIATKTVESHLSAIYRTLHIPQGRNARVAAVLEFLRDTYR